MNIKHNPKIATMRTHTVQLGKRPSAPEVTWPTIHRGAGGGGGIRPGCGFPAVLRRRGGRPRWTPLGSWWRLRGGEGQPGAAPPPRRRTRGRVVHGRGGKGGRGKGKGCRGSSSKGYRGGRGGRILAVVVHTSHHHITIQASPSVLRRLRTRDAQPRVPSCGR